MQVYECILSLIGGVGVFILAMKLMSDSLNEIAGDRMKNLLEKIAGNRIKGVLIGAFVTAVIQSSSATTVMVIGFVNANVMTLNQAASIIIGSNIGTTVTGLLASLESLNVSLYLSLLVFIGVMLAFIKKIKKIANLMTGLGMIFVGLKLMSSACNDDSIKNAMAEFLQKISFPLILEFFGVIFTAIIQSSSAMTGIVIVMVGNGAMGMDSGLFITLGANVGTCVTALIGIIGANNNSKRTAVIHLVFNICGCLLFTPILWIFKEKIIELLGSLVSKEAMQIAYFHLVFNITTAIITTPLIDYLVKIAFMVVKEPKEEDLIDSFMKEKENFEIGNRDTTTDITADINIEKKEDENNIINEKDNNYEPPKLDENKSKEGKEEKIEVKDNNIEENKEEKKEEEEKKEDEKIEIKEEKKEEEEKKEDEKKEEEKKEEEKKEEEIIEVKEEKNEEEKKEEKVEENHENKEEEQKNDENNGEEKKENDK